MEGFSLSLMLPLSLTEFRDNLLVHLGHLGQFSSTRSVDLRLLSIDYIEVFRQTGNQITSKGMLNRLSPFARVKCTEHAYID